MLSPNPAAQAKRDDEYSSLLSSVSDKRGGGAGGDPSTSGDPTASGNQSLLAGRSVRPEYRLEKWAAPLALPASVANLYYRAYSRAVQEKSIPEETSFMHYVCLAVRYSHSPARERDCASVLRSTNPDQRHFCLQALSKDAVADLMTRSPVGMSPFTYGC